MLRFIALHAFFGCVFAGIIPKDLNGRIVNGVDTTIEAHPYQVSLLTYDGHHFCGGSIISEDIIVTAAHCMQILDANQFRVRLGSTEYNKGGELVAVKAFKRHEKFNRQSLMYDVAVIKLATPVRESSKVRYIKLAKKIPPTGTTAVVTGWGVKCFLFCSTPTIILQKVEVDVIDEKRCASSEFDYGNEIKETMFCAKGVHKDACQGDSGGPLVAKDKLIGIVSWGTGCALSNYPGVYSDIASLRDWIEQTAKEL